MSFLTTRDGDGQEEFWRALGDGAGARSILELAHRSGSSIPYGFYNSGDLLQPFGGDIIKLIPLGDTDDNGKHELAVVQGNLIHILGEITDDEGPVTSNVLATPNPVAAATSLVDITANVDDTTTGGSNIVSASYTLNGGGATSMAAADGAFDEPVEDVTATLADMLLVGVYDVCVSGTDAADNTGTEECTFLVVYDPDAGFVTGGGWIESPIGAYVADPTLTGKANFGFVAKYKKGQSVPDGNTEFQFKAGDLNFKSADYDWLVVAGAKGMFKGSGTHQRYWQLWLPAHCHRCRSHAQHGRRPVPHQDLG